MIKSENSGLNIGGRTDSFTQDRGPMRRSAVGSHQRGQAAEC